MAVVQNPILRGFNPDPSIIRVENDYYIATSTFEWFPGVQIHHSTDLVNWELVKRPLDRVSQLDMLGNPDSCGVWAPCLSYHEGTYYLVYSNVRSFDGTWKDTPNFLVTTDDIMGNWSDPIFLSASGFDGSLFHDDDGKKWFVCLLVDHRKGKFFGGIFLQEYDLQQKKLVGEVHHIFEGTELGITEGPHLYKKDGYYYLVTAEGGTEYGHAVSVARSKSITGPYEVHPQNPIVSARNNPDSALQRTGHGDFVQTPEGNWYIVFLASRPLMPLKRCTLGRETAIEAVTWEERKWPVLTQGSSVPRISIEIPSTQEKRNEETTFVEHFDEKEISIHFQSLRVPIEKSWVNLEERSGFLRLYGRESLSSFHRQSLLAQRVQAFHIQAECAVDFTPENFQQMAGLVCYYNTAHFHYLYISSEEGKRVINIISNDKHVFSEPLAEPVEIDSSDTVYLKVDFNREVIQFYYSTDLGDWKTIGPLLDGSILSDDYVRDDEVRYRPAFTGAFVGVCCQDLTGNKKYADFDWFKYKEIKE